MGSAQSSTIKQTISIVNESMTNLVSKNVTSGKATALNKNSVKLIMRKATVKYCTEGIDITQKIDSKQAIKVMTQFTSLSDMKAQMTTALQNTVAQKNQSEQGAMATALSVQNNKSSIDQAIKNKVENNVTNENLTEINAFISNLNEGVLDMSESIIECDRSKGGKVVTVNQGIVNKQLVDMLSKAAIGNTITTDTDSTASAASTSDNTSKQQGMIDAFSNLLKGPLVVIGIIVVILAILAYVFRGTISKVAEKKFAFGKRKLRFGRRKFRFH